MKLFNRLLSYFESKKEVESPKIFSNDNLLEQASDVAAYSMEKLISYIQDEFKCDRDEATLTASVLTFSTRTIIERDKNARNDVQETVNDFKRRKNNFENKELFINTNNQRSDQKVDFGIFVSHESNNKEIVNASKKAIKACFQFASFLHLEYKVTEIEAVQLTAAFINTFSHQLDSNPNSKSAILEIINGLKK